MGKLSAACGLKLLISFVLKISKTQIVAFVTASGLIVILSAFGNISEAADNATVGSALMLSLKNTYYLKEVCHRTSPAAYMP